MLKVSCPKCKHVMNYEPRGGMISSKTKTCVYCGHTFKVHSNQEKSRIIQISKK